MAYFLNFIIFLLILDLIVQIYIYLLHQLMLAHKEVSLAEKKELIPKIYKIITLIFIIGNYMLCFGLMIFDYELFELITYYSLGYAVVLIISYFFRLMIGVTQSIRIMNDEKKRVSQKLPSLPHLNTYAFVIPSYKEELSVLRRTLSELVSHECSHQYLVVLAMEQNEVDSDKKAEILIREYSASFRGIEFTRHVPQPGEAQGKTANVNWAAMRLEPIFAKYGIDPSQVELTIMDADSLIPDVYIREIEKNCREGKDKHNFIFGLPQVYSINREESQMIGRIYDTLYSYMQYSIYHSFFGAGSPISNYSISYQTLQEIGYNDTHKDAIAEDMHIIIKTISKTKGRVQSHPIYAFSNQMSLYGGKGIYEEFMAKFWQQERHQRAVIEIGYAFHCAVEDGFKSKQIIGTFFTYFLIWFDQMVLLWYTANVVYKLFSGLLSSAAAVAETSNAQITQTIDMLGMIVTIVCFINLVIYLAVRFSFEINVLKLKFNFNKFVQIVETLIFFSISTIIFANTTGIVAAVQLFNENAKYEITEKKKADL